MGNLASLAETHEIMKRFAARVGFSEPAQQRAVAVYENCKEHGIETIRDAFTNFEKQELKYFPKLGDIIAKVKSISKRDERFSPADGRCKYHDFNECNLSKQLCEKNVTADAANVSNLMFGKVLCGWHSLTEKSRRNPSSTESKIVEGTLASFRKSEDFGANNPNHPSKYQKQEVYGSVFKEINT